MIRGWPFVAACGQLKVATPQRQSNKILLMVVFGLIRASCSTARISCLLRSAWLAHAYGVLPSPSLAVKTCAAPDGSVHSSWRITSDLPEAIAAESRLNLSSPSCHLTSLPVLPRSIVPRQAKSVQPTAVRSASLHWP